MRLTSPPPGPALQASGPLIDARSRSETALSGQGIRVLGGLLTI